MRALVLTTRFRQGQFEGDACLLVYDELTLDGAAVGDDVRDVLNGHPNTPHIYVLAPFWSLDECKAAVCGGTGPHRASSSGTGIAGQLAVIGLQKEKGNGRTRKIASVVISVSNGVVTEQPPVDLPPDLQHGWLFDLFDKSKARVDAPPGVHFGKTSGKHSDKFLRTSAALLSTRACAAVAFFALNAASARTPRRIFVDTAPLLSVALAMGRIATVQGVWDRAPPAQSFSSYGGLSSPDMPAFGVGDLCLISASTSGNLSKRLVEQEGAAAEGVITLFALQENTVDSVGALLCDLTYRPGKTFGYAAVTNYGSQNCLLCKRGFVLASLEGDQFLLEKLGVKRVKVVRTSQADDAREVIDLFAKKSVFSVERYNLPATVRTNVAVDVVAAFEVSDFRSTYLRLLTRFTPAPVSYVVLENLTRATFDQLVVEAKLEHVFAGAKYIGTQDIAQQEVVPHGNALVAIGYLSDYASVRSVNAQLRVKVPRGCVAYLSALTCTDTPKNLASLRTFLSYGEHGPETFLYRAAYEFLFPGGEKAPSSWERELELLRQLQSEPDTKSDEFLARIRDLEDPHRVRDRLFLPGMAGELEIANDFVYLDTSSEKGAITQADIYVTVSNALASAKCDNKGLRAEARKTVEIEWQQTVYGHVLLCPTNFLNYNDAILRASFLRACSPAELCFAVDSRSSSEVLDICLAELDNWSFGKGDALPEFLMAMATRRMTLEKDDTLRLCNRARSAALPPYLMSMINVISAQ